MQSIRGWSHRLWTALALVGALGLVAAPAYAEEEEGSQKDKIQKQMEKIRKLMQENETALLDLSAGVKAKAKDVDVKIPDGQAGRDGEGDDAGAKSGEDARKKIDELLRKQQESGEPIPDEITRLVKMIPL